MTIYDKYYLKDARELSKNIKSNSIDTIITSPPYGRKKNYGIKNQIGYGQTHSEYLNDLKNVFNKCYNILKNTGSIWIICDTYKENSKTIPLPFEITDIMDELGWILQDIIIWDKTKTLPYSRKGQLRNVFEYILFFSKTQKFKYFIDRIKEPDKLKQWWVKYPERYNPKGKNPSNIWKFTIPTQGIWGNGKIEHFCPFPPLLVERIILLTTNKNDVIFDPFAGSGVVLAQAKWMKRKYIGFDINEEFIKRFYKDVSPEIERLWNVRNPELIGQKKNQIKLERKIQKLRQLKYASILSKSIINEYPSSILFALVINIPKSKGILRQNIFLVVNKHNKEIKNLCAKLIDEKPFSKFEINPTINIINSKNIYKEISNNKLYYLYLDGEFNYYKQKISFQSFLEGVTTNNFTYKKIPPIISNISIRQEIPKTN